MGDSGRHGRPSQIAAGRSVSGRATSVSISRTTTTANFIDCVKSRKETIAPCETAHRSATPGHLGQIAMRVGRTIRFNPDTEEILDDPDAVRLLSRPMRGLGVWGAEAKINVKYPLNSSRTGRSPHASE